LRILASKGKEVYAMRTVKKFQLAAALMWGLLGETAAGDGIRPIDSCGTLTAEDRSSFVLVRNISTSAQDCLVIRSSGVTIDLNGFNVFGNGTGTGIVAAVQVEGTAVRNGGVKGFAVGISLGGTGNVVEKVRVNDNTDTGMFLGASSLVDRVVAQGNRNHGIVLGTAATISNSTIRANGNNPNSVGLSVGAGSTVTGNTIWASIGTGLFASVGSTVIGNTVFDSNPGAGMSVICPSNVQNNTVTANTTGNIFLSNDGLGCLAVNNVTQ
jgi:parallel beta helix pectate lyase-like protein